ncbi:hypothetical protein GCM10011519_35480 [Marmoricola endophyticus]|uniref:DUF3099 domain-containing protein n=1 Tax=Marmoricola endophyticus TaxID=2040280 RepID=A0A917BWN9_9ACTN|nr:DUF3099 domain-containing protein [Marmoricola endophyticus]GGF58578.1 hypothetical protein GCM10011519_35480 [Marmoricola endophyticus]
MADSGRRPSGRPRHDFTPDRDPGLSRRRKEYAVIMGTCVVLILLAWNLVRLWSVPAAVVMSVVAALLAPTAVIVANRTKGD